MKAGSSSVVVRLPDQRAVGVRLIAQRSAADRRAVASANSPEGRLRDRPRFGCPASPVCPPAGPTDGRDDPLCARRSACRTAPTGAASEPAADPPPTSTCRSTSGRGLVLAEPDPRRLGHVRLRHRVRRRRRRRAPGRHLLQGHDAQAADRQRDAARDRDAGRACSTRSASRTRASTPSSRSTPALDRLADARHRQRRRANRSTTTSRSCGGSTACPAWPGSSSTSRARTSARAGSSSRSTPTLPARVTAAVRRATDLPLLVKLSPNVADVRPIARAIEDAGADALTAINTLSGIAVAPSPSEAAARATSTAAFGPGDQAGRAADRLRGQRRSSTSRSSRSAASPSSPTCSTTSRSAPRRSRSGTAIFADPTLPVRLVDELAAECRRRGLDVVSRRSSAPRCRRSRARRRPRASSTGRDRGPTQVKHPAPLDFAAMTTIQPALEASARAAVAARTEALFRRVRRAPRGPFPAQERPPRRRATSRSSPVLPGSRRRRASCAAFWAGRHRARRRRLPRRSRRRADDRRRHPRLRDRRASSASRAIFAEEVRDDDGVDAARVPARLPDRARGARPARRRHPDDRRLAARDDPGGRGAGRRDRRMRGPRRPERRAADPHFADDRPRLLRSARSGSSTSRPTSPDRETCPAAPRSAARGAGQQWHRGVTS